MKDETAIALLIVLVIASAGAGYYVGNSGQRTTTVVSTITQPFPFANMTAPQCSTSATLPCGFTGGTQGIFVITNASLTLSPPTNPNSNRSGVLSLTIVHTGNYEGTALTVWLCQLYNTTCTKVLQTTTKGQSRTYTASIPASFALTRGTRYEVVVASQYYNPSELGGGGEVEELNIALTAV